MTKVRVTQYLSLEKHVRDTLEANPDRNAFVLTGLLMALHERGVLQVCEIADIVSPSVFVEEDV